jgi:H+-translocating NAD(P) transhydrogenase subunit beta
VTRGLLIQASYLAASVLFILGLRGLTRPDRARRGMQLAAVGMLVAVVGTLLDRQIVDFRWILAGLVVGSLVGYPMGMWVPMTAMPQRIAISHMFGALAATLVGVAEFLVHGRGAAVGHGQMAALGFEVLFGSLTITGSLVAFLKLQEVLPGRPLTFRGQNLLSVALFAGALGLFGWLVISPANPSAFLAMAGIGLVFGVSLVLPIGGADMPVVISLLNSYAGLASSATGFAIGNDVLIIAGALDGASGFVLSIAMSKGMNRSFGNVLFGAFGKAPPPGKTGAREVAIRSITPEDAAIQLGFAHKVIVVPGYGMAVAQAQHQVRELANVIEKNGGEVVFAIHPVAGRMPGHMNVLLAEADVPYDRLKEMDEVNPEFPEADAVLVVGANDVVNPAARNDPSSPIHGMPILDVDKAKSVIVLKRTMGPGFAGIENELFHMPQTSMLFGDARQSLQAIVSEIKAAAGPPGVTPSSS